MKKIGRILIWVFLLGIGFFVGTSWNNKDSTNVEDVNKSEKPVIDIQKIEELSTTSKLLPSENTIIKLFENAAPSVTFITTSKVQRDYWSMNVYEIPSGTGSGFIWDDEGHIVTNFHVIQGASRIEVTLANQNTYEAILVGVEPRKDLAVLKIDAPKEEIRPLSIGSSMDLRVGQTVLAIGNPFGLDQTLTTGIISALGREINSVADIPIRDVIQTDAAINPGNSGGPLINSSGKLIGVNTAIYSPSGAYAGIGFSIPVDVVSWVVPDLIKYGKVKRATLGVEIASSRIHQRLGIEGVLIMNVGKGSSAETAGLRPTYRNQNGRIELGDIILAINGEKITTGNDLLLSLEKFAGGEEVLVNILRVDKKIELKIVLDET